MVTETVDQVDERSNEFLNAVIRLIRFHPTDPDNHGRTGQPERRFGKLHGNS
jgi:hypothetical protein